MKSPSISMRPSANDRRSSVYVDLGPWDQTDHHSLLLRHLEGWQQVAVAAHYGRVSDLVLGREQGEV